MGSALGMTGRGLVCPVVTLGRDVDVARDHMVCIKLIISVRTSLLVWSFGRVGILWKSIEFSSLSDISITDGWVHSLLLSSSMGGSVM